MAGWESLESTGTLYVSFVAILAHGHWLCQRLPGNMEAAWMVKSWDQGTSPLELLAEKVSTDSRTLSWRQGRVKIPGREGARLDEIWSPYLALSAFPHVADSNLWCPEEKSSIMTYLCHDLLPRARLLSLGCQEKSSSFRAALGVGVLSTAETLRSQKRSKGKPPLPSAESLY